MRYIATPLRGVRDKKGNPRLVVVVEDTRTGRLECVLDVGYDTVGDVLRRAFYRVREDTYIAHTWVVTPGQMHALRMKVKT